MINFDKIEWYDNSRITKILECPRRAYYEQIYNGGLAYPVSAGANIGSAFHAAIARYYHPHDWTILTEYERRQKALSEFEKQHSFYFSSREPERRHTLDRCLQILGHYFDAYLFEDRIWRPIEIELFAIFEIKPEKNEDFQSFYFAMRADGVFEHTKLKHLYVLENKTTKSIRGEVDRLTVNRQTTGYTYGLRLWNTKVEGVLANIILIAVEKLDCRREVFKKTEAELASWRKQTINIVQDWRKKKLSLDGELSHILDTFYQNDRQCTTYGICPFFKACQFNAPIMLTGMEKNTWTPLQVKEYP